MKNKTGHAWYGHISTLCNTEASNLQNILFPKVAIAQTFGSCRQIRQNFPLQNLRYTVYTWYN